MKKINGSWDLIVSNQNKDKGNVTIEYEVQDKASIIQVSEATATPTSLNITFSLGGI